MLRRARPVGATPRAMAVPSVRCGSRGFPISLYRIAEVGDAAVVCSRVGASLPLPRSEADGYGVGEVEGQQAFGGEFGVGEAFGGGEPDTVVAAEGADVDDERFAEFANGKRFCKALVGRSDTDRVFCPVKI